MEIYDKLMLEKVFGLDFEQGIEELVNDLAEEITGEKKLEVDECIEGEEIVINYSPQDRVYNLADEPDRSTALSILAGLPYESFDKAEEEYKELLDEYGSEEDYILEGHLARGALAKYAAIMSQQCGINYEVISYNSLGIKRLSKFSGNEFLGYKLGFFYYLDDLINQSGSSNAILYSLIDKGVIKYGNISCEYRDEFNEGLNVEKMKEILIEIFDEKLNLENEAVKELVEEEFNPKLVECKMRFIEKYQDNKLEMDDSGIELSTDEAKVEINQAKLELSAGGKSITFSKSGIDLG